MAVERRCAAGVAGAVVVALAAFLSCPAASATDGTYVLWSVAPGGSRTQVASLPVAPVRLLDRSAGGMLAVETDQDLVVEGPGGESPTVIAPAPPRAAWFSPDGRWLAYETAPCPAGCVDLFVANVDGTAPRLIAHDMSGVGWSPNGRELAFVGDGDPNGVGRLFTVKVATPGDRVDHGRAWDLTPQFSPSGRQIAFACASQALCVLTLATGRVERFSTNVGAAMWSPDGSRIAVAYPGNYNQGVAVANVVSRRVHVLSAPQYVSVEDRPLAWSPDSKSLLWQHHCGGGAAGFPLTKLECRDAVIREWISPQRRKPLWHDDRFCWLTRWTARGISYYTYTGAGQPEP